MYPDQLYMKLRDFIKKHTGIIYTERDNFRLDGRIRDILKKLEVESDMALLAMFDGPMTVSQRETIVDVATNNETLFFRDNKPFEFIKNSFLEEVKDESKINIWSAACSSGQESLSLVMSIYEKMPMLIQSGKIDIQCTDISESILEKAQKREFSQLEVQRGLPIQLLIKFFNQDVKSDSWKFKDEYAKGLSYSKFNLLESVYPKDKYHLIFCRNVLIYFNQESKQKVIDGISNSLKPGGYLVLGSGESLIGLNSGLKQVTLSDQLVYKKES